MKDSEIAKDETVVYQGVFDLSVKLKEMYDHSVSDVDTENPSNALITIGILSYVIGELDRILTGEKEGK